MIAERRKIGRDIEGQFKTVLTEKTDLYRPLRIESVDRGVRQANKDRIVFIDYLLDIGYRDRTYAFQVETKVRSTPIDVREAIPQLARNLLPGRYPMLALPYLSTTIVSMLNEAGMSGIDLNGNYSIITPELVAIRLDQPNRYPEPKQIRNIYAGSSSIVGRYLLVEPGPFQQVNQIASGITSFGGAISLATISKVLNGLTDDLIVSRRRKEIRLVQPRKLLERLRAAYRPPKMVGTMRLQLPGERQEMEQLLSESLGPNDWIWSGESSAAAYAVTTPEQIGAAYTRAGQDRLQSLRGYEESRFYNCELRRSNDSFVYFARNGQSASQIETYLALSQLDKREREIASDIEQEILEGTYGNS